MDNQVAAVFYHLLLSSSDEESSDEENGLPVRPIRGVQNLRPRIQNFVLGVVNHYSDGEFRENFRMFRPTFDHILSLIENKLIPDDGKGRHPVTPKNQLLFTIWYFAAPDCYRVMVSLKPSDSGIYIFHTSQVKSLSGRGVRSICSRFNIGKATALRTVRRVTDAILGISNTFIKWPTEDYVETVKNSFSEMGFPNTIGALDGCYIPIPTPKENGLSYICRKNFAALILQGVCDHRLLFTHCYVGEVGSTHDANVLKRSELISFLTNRQLEKFPNDTHLVADKAYPCLQTLMVPFKDNGQLTNEQRHFNYLLSKARCTIERAFALLKKRFRCLKFFDIKDIEWACKYILACCVLHNICILQNDILEIDDIIENEEDENPGLQAHELDRNLLRLGSNKRMHLCDILGL